MMEKGFKPTYLKTIHNQLSAILNYAINFYELRSNPCRKAGSMGKSRADERLYWILEEFQKFSDEIMDKLDSWVTFQILFWMRMRLGELLALQVKDINFEAGMITVAESLARIDGENLITASKTEGSISAKSDRWVCLSEQIKENNNIICNLTGEYKKIESDCREGVRAQLERMKELCKECNSLYEKQNDLKGQKYKIEKTLQR